MEVTLIGEIVVVAVYVEVKLVAVVVDVMVLTV